jgi:uncharacterized protein (DUF433 family)
MIGQNGHYVVADPTVCHGELTFRGTRILVRDVVEQVAMGLDWDTICQQWRGAITKEAIAEAVRLAGQSLQNHTEHVEHATP